MERRKFLTTGASAALAGTVAVGGSALAAPKVARGTGAGDSGITVSTPDGINPPGIRTAGIRMVPVVGGKYKVWTKKVGSGPIKVLLLHGGPGLSHAYLEAMEAFLPQAGIEMYYYDQLGCGNSDQPDDASLWNVPRYLEELEEVRRGLGLDKFVLYGHSWGAMLGIEYALKYPQRLRAMVLSNMTAGMQAYVKYVDTLKALLPPELRAELAALEAKQAYDSPEYEKIMYEHLYPQVLCRISPWPEPLERAVKQMNATIYQQMQGKSEFLMTGNMKDWERWDRLHEIKVRTLTMGAKHDTMDPKDMQKMAALMPNATSAICENGSHLSMWDDQESYFRHLMGFLKTV